MRRATKPTTVWYRQGAQGEIPWAYSLMDLIKKPKTGVNRVIIVGEGGESRHYEVLWERNYK